MARLLQELKKCIRAEVDESRRGADTNSEKLVLCCPGTVFTHVFLQVSPALDESSRTDFALSRSCCWDSFQTLSTVLSLVCWCCSAMTVSHQVLLTRLSEIQISLYGSVINTKGLVSFVSFNTMLPYVARRYHGFHEEGTDGMHVYKNDLNDIYIVTLRQVTIDQIVQETVEISQLQYIDNVVKISVVGIVQVSRMHVVTKTDEIPQLLIVEKIVENSQLQWDKCSRYLNIIIPIGMFILIVWQILSKSLRRALANSWVRQQTIWMMWTEPMKDQRHCGSYCVRPRVISKVRGLSLRATSHGYASRSILVVTMNTWTMPSHSTVKDAIHWDRWQLASCAAFAMHTETFNGECHVMWEHVCFHCREVTVLYLKRITSSNDGWIRGWVWEIVLQNLF